ncbi:MAG: GAF domain-containing protein [Chloroflexota bacterium]|nr:GAF domain-containing protein [Chloroflexota bacterium]
MIPAGPLSRRVRRLRRLLPNTSPRGRRAGANRYSRHARDVAEKSGYLPTTILAVPVMSPGGETVGVLELLDRQGQPTYSLTDMELLGTFAEQIALVFNLRRSQISLGALVGRTLASLGGLPPTIKQTSHRRARGRVRRPGGSRPGIPAHRRVGRTHGRHRLAGAPINLATSRNRGSMLPRFRRRSPCRYPSTL